MPDAEGYFARGIQKNAISEANAAQRAISMLLAKLNNQSFETEIVAQKFDKIPPSAPVVELRSAVIALVTDGGLVPKGNPEKMPANGATRYAANDIAGLDDLTSELFEAVHGGYDTRLVNEDPDRLVPLDVMRQMEREGVIGKLLEVVYATAGLTATMENATRTGAKIAEHLKEHGVQGAILTST
jgi:glycine reductase